MWNAISVFRLRQRLGIACVVVLFAIWSLPGVIALRSMLMLLAAGLLATRAARASAWRSIADRPMPWLMLALLTAWIVIEAIVVSPEPKWAIGEIKGQWLMALFAAAIGLLFGSHASAGRILTPRASASLLMSGFALAALASVAISLMHLFSSGELLRNEVPVTGGHLEMSFIMNILLAAITVDLLMRAERQTPLFAGPATAVLFTLLVALFCSYLANSRNGMIGMAFLGLSALVLFAMARWRRVGGRAAIATALALIAAGGAYAYLHVASDSRWERTLESARLGWDIVEQPRWLEAPMPVLQGGDAAEASAFIRVSYIHAGLRLIADNPWGVGYGRNAFGHALARLGAEEVGTGRVGHAHSGFIDLGIATGIPGLILWLAFAASLLIVGAKSYFRSGNRHGLLLLLLSAGYAGRMCVDTVNRDHMLQLYFFLVGYLMPLLSLRDSSSSRAEATSSTSMSEAN